MYMRLPLPVLKCFLHTAAPLDEMASKELVVGLRAKNSTVTERMQRTPKEGLHNRYGDANLAGNQERCDNSVRHQHGCNEISGSEQVKILEDNEISGVTVDGGGGGTSSIFSGGQGRGGTLQSGWWVVDFVNV